MKHNTQILAPKYRTQNGKRPASRLKRKPCRFSYFTSTSNGNYFRSFPYYHSRTSGITLATGVGAHTF